MGIAKILIWAILFLIATFFWLVLFEHGIAQMDTGIREELRAIGEFFSGS